MGLAHTATCMHPQQAAVLLCTLLYSTVRSTGVQYLYFKPRMSGSKCESCGLTHLALLRSAKCQERMERGERKKQERRNQRSATQEVAGGCSLPEEALVSFWGTGPERRMVRGDCSHSRG